ALIVLSYHHVRNCNIDPPNTIYTWMRAARRRGSTEALSRDLKSRTAELEKRLAKVSNENDQLKRLLAEKELELAILRELRDKANPR
ncbi:MAG TPA: transposase, partial [Bacillota bacterium]|nr:transposase [Bacillota bacterium]